MSAIYVEKLTKKYRTGVQALNEINLSVKQGEIFSLLGENGAGKSTLIRLLTTFLSPTSGTIKILGKNTKEDASWIRSKIACVSQNPSIDNHLSLCENMLFQSQLYNIPKDEAQKRMHSLIESFSLQPFLNYPVSSYSGGVKRRLDIALNMMSNPQILFLDEPTVGMDVQSRNAMWDVIKKIHMEFHTTIFLTTHYLEEADLLSDTICIMKNGKEIIQGTPHTLKEVLRNNCLCVTLTNEADVTPFMSLLHNHFPNLKVVQHNTSFKLEINKQLNNLFAINQLLLDQKIPFYHISVEQPSLEDVFLRLTESGGTL